jgi:hypothetical protein
MVASPLPRVAVPIDGASGTVAGTTELLVAEAVLVPTAFVAITVKVYVVPLIRPVMVIGEDPPDAVCPPLEVTVYEVIAEPPVLPGALKVIVASPLPAVAVPMVGAPGVVAGVTAPLALEAVLVPMVLVAFTVKVYAVPLLNPVIVMGDEPPYATKPPVFEKTV